jgi:hypothetical protein
MGQSHALELPRGTPDEPEVRIGDLAQELLLPLQAVRLGMVLVRRQTPRASQVITKMDATLQAMERVVDQLLDASQGLSAGRQGS